MADLFPLADLVAASDQQIVDLDLAIVARSIATSWLQAACRVDEWQEPIPADLSEWALELALLYMDIPIPYRDVGDYSRTKSEGVRMSILRDASRRYGRLGFILRCQVY